MEIKPLIPIGTKIKVDKSKLATTITQNLLDEYPQVINCNIIDYKMTDGMGIGYVLMTENKVKVWIFSSELDDQTKREYKIDDKANSNDIKIKSLIFGDFGDKYEINGSKGIKDLVNPINLISWLLFTLKDIF